MRTKQLFLTLAGICMLGASCMKDDSVDPSNPNASVPDPEGTVVLSMRNDRGTSLPGSDIYIDRADNFTGAVSYFVSLGKVNGLGNVSYIPKTGWTKAVAVTPGEGYVAYSNGRFFRIFVMSYTTNILNEVIGAEIKYQAPFGGIDEAVAIPNDAKSLTFESNRTESNILFTNKTIIPCTFEFEKAHDQIMDALYYHEDGIPRGIRFYIFENKKPEDIKNKLIIKTLTGKTTEVEITIKGCEPYINLYYSNYVPLKNDISCDYKASTITIRCETNVALDELTLTSSTAWCQAEFSPTDMTITLSLLENVTGQDRTTNLTIGSKNGRLKKDLKITQKTLEITTPQSTVDFDRLERNISLTLTPADVSYTATSSNESWCTFSWNKNTLTIRATANSTNKDRSASIKVTARGISKIIPVNQNRYTPGDYFNENKVTGVVFRAAGLQGGIVSMDETTAIWSTENIVTGATDRDNGINNMNIIRAIPNWKTLYPAFAWCEAKNINGITGWYLPAYKDIQEASENFNSINATLSNKGGTPLQGSYADYHYRSSSESNNINAYNVAFANRDVAIIPKNSSCRVRAVRAF